MNLNYTKYLLAAISLGFLISIEIFAPILDQKFGISEFFSNTTSKDKPTGNTIKDGNKQDLASYKPFLRIHEFN